MEQSEQIKLSSAELARVEAQENALVFPEFGNEDALKLGLLIVDVAKEYGWAMAVNIEVCDTRYFSYLMPGTTAENLNYMRRKINLVHYSGHSSYFCHHQLIVKGKDLVKDHGLSDADYVAVGGSFPIKIRGGAMIGTVTVSGRPHKEDHQLVTEAISRFLGSNK
ncbi:MAG: heme-degrading domain-containing protein [Clostridia bacterium]|nr:heme-degrading domain-containing protein [Clostridia bacterium]